MGTHSYRMSEGIRGLQYTVNFIFTGVDATLQTVPTCFSVAYATVDSLRTDCGFSAPHPRSRRHGRDHQVNLIPSVCPRLPCVFF
ncbi:hypothetical protein F2P81_009135 [Scophthalmus maximus]|uniref:Uncharacterized protein n=1 Tax=Scophthalmus maximus TaxID=52904 RepID=A0A6A4T6A3_SCOMX|nr:hypothetical protein F2P81_009135 [Scophthalmus maximus]